MPISYYLSQPKPRAGIYLLSEANVAAAQDGAPRRFDGIANSGKPFVYEGRTAIIDLSSLRFADNLPALIDHDRAKRAGFGKLSIVDNQLSISGTLLANEHGKAIADDGDAGFPWQMSAHIVPAAIEDLPAGKQKTVNGQLLAGPLRILKNALAREISFTPTGVDSQTSAVVLSDDGTIDLPNTQQEESMNLEEALNEINKLKQQLSALESEKAALEKAKADLEKAAADAETEAQAAAVEAQLSQAGFAKTADGKGWQGISQPMVNVLLSADKESLVSLINDLKPNKNAPDYLLGEQHPPLTGQGMQLSANPLLANAEQRAKQDKNYV